MTITMFIQMKMTPKSEDKNVQAQQRIFMFMPFIFLFICYNFASALALYWTVQNIFGIQCEILVPAATPDVIHRGNLAQVEAKLILQGANIPATAEAETILYERGIVNVPDFIANAGGVICAAVEYAGGTRTQAFETIREKIAENTARVLSVSRDRGILPRRAALSLAEARVRTAMAHRRWGLF